MSLDTDLGLRMAYERYRDFASVAADWFWEMDADLRFVWLSEEIAEYFGRAPSWYHGRTRDELLSPEQDRNQWNEHLELLLARRPFREFIYSRVAPDGDLCWIATSGRPIFSEDGVFEGYRGSARVCTEEVKARLDAYQLEHRMRESLDVLDDAYALYDADDRLIAWNQAFRQVNGVVADLIRPGVSFKTLVETAIARGAPRGQRSAKDAVNWRLERHRQAEGAFEHQNRSGQWHLVRERRTGDGSTVAIWTDITELKRAQAAESEANERSRVLATAIEQLAEIFVLWDEADRLVICNQPFRKLNARIPEVTRPGTPFSAYVQRAVEEGLVPEAQGREAAWVGERMARHRTPKESFEVWREDGRCLLIHEERIGSGTVTLALDITAQKTAELEIRQAQKLRAVGQLVGGIAHDFNNLLATVLANAELGLHAIEGGTDARTARALAEVRTAAERGRDVVRQLLTFVRSEQRESVTTLCAPVVEETVSLLRATFPASVRLEVAIDAVSAIRFDPVQLQQVIMNLCINARDAMQGAGNLGIEVTERDWEGECASCGRPVAGRFVVLGVSDDGPGVPEGIAEQIFDPFYTTKIAGEGSGMGLSMVHGIVHRFGGHIGIENPPGGGARFVVLMQPGELGPVECVPERVASGSPARGEHHVVVVDDDGALADVLGTFLGEAGYQVSVYTEPREALAAFEAAPRAVDLLISDQTMPELSGLDLALAMRKLRADFPVILCTGYSDVVDDDGAQECGISAYFDKPLRLVELISEVDALLTGAPAASKGSVRAARRAYPVPAP